MKTFALALVLFVAACGGAQTPGETTPPPSGGTNPAASNVAWKDMDHGQRLEFMKTTVMPKMKAEFAAFDAKMYANVNCMTCHGEGAKNGSFKMPNPQLPPVPTTQEGFGKLMAEKPQVVQFMMNKVVPDMAALLGEPPFDPKTHQGFGCHDCHTPG